MTGNMDFSVLPNNNHPDKFLQLDVKSLAKTSAFLQTWLANFPDVRFPREQLWHNRVYSQVSSFESQASLCISYLDFLLVVVSAKKSQILKVYISVIITLLSFEAPPSFVVSHC